MSDSDSSKKNTNKKEESPAVVEGEEASISDTFLEMFDYVMIFPLRKVEKEKKQGCCPGGGCEKRPPKEEFVPRRQTTQAKNAIKAMLEAGLELYIYESAQKDELIVLVEVPDAVLYDFADKIDYTTLLEPTTMKLKLEAGNSAKRIARVHFPPNDPIQTTIEPFDYIYGRYKKTIDQSLYQKDSQGSIFDPTSRLKLAHYVLTGPKRHGGCDISIMKLVHAGNILSYFPVHDKAELKSLYKNQMKVSTMPWKQPFDDIKEYFGEKFALYNAFLGHYSLYLIIPSAVGFCFQIVVWKTGNFSHPVLPFFGVIITLWAVCMLEMWKGKESQYAMRWGTLGFEDEEPDRPDFVGRNEPSQISGRMVANFPLKMAKARKNASFMIIISFILLVITVVAGIYWLRFALQSKIGTYASTVASVLNTVQITIFNMVYQWLVTRLTNLENHRTDTLYQDSLITKLFLFQFVNSYASFFYLAFIASWLPTQAGMNPDYKGQCGWYDCMQPLSINLAIIFGTRLVVTNATELLLPYVTRKQRLEAETSSRSDPTKHYELTVVEHEYIRLAFDPMYDSIKNYADTVIQYGFMTLFITALPIACMFDMISNYVKLRIQAVNMRYNFQRPIPMAAEDIGSWQTIFTFMAVIAVISNAALICFTMDLHPPQMLKYKRVWVFIGFQWVLIGLQFILVELIPDRPPKVDIQIRRQAFIVSKLIDFTEDDDYTEDSSGKAEQSQEFVDLGCNGCMKTVRLKKDPNDKRRGSTLDGIKSYPFYKNSEFPGKGTKALPALINKGNLATMQRTLQNEGGDEETTPDLVRHNSIDVYSALDA